MIGLMTIPEAVEEAQGACADGVRALQVKARGVFPEDHELIERCVTRCPTRSSCGSARIRGYHHLGAKGASAAVQALTSAGCNAVEQPTANFDSMAAVRAAVDIPIVADESCLQPEDAVEVANRGVADVISISLAKSGGISRANEWRRSPMRSRFPAT
jgi:O-succinylbenzoate synthase